MSDGADDFFKSGTRPVRRRPTPAPENLEPTPEEPQNGEESVRPQESSVTDTVPSAPSPDPQKDSPTEQKPPPRRRNADAALDKLFGNIPQKESPPSPTDSRPPRRSRTSPDELLSRLADKQPEERRIDGPLTVNPDFERYLSPETWRRLHRNAPQRRTLINAQERMRSVLFQLSTFLPSNLVQEKMQHPVPGLVSGKMLRGSLLFSDVSGFTALSERLAALGSSGAERLTALMNHYFEVILDIIAVSGGILLKFAGDAILVYYPRAAGSAGRRESQHRKMAARTGLRLLAVMREFTDIEVANERVSLKMKIGIASGEFLAANIGSAKRMEYAVLGPAVSGVLHAEGASTGAGQIIVDQETAAGLDDTFTCTAHKAGFFWVTSDNHSLDQFEIQAGAQRNRSGINWSADPQEILQNMGITLQQIKAILPFMPEEISNRIISQHAQRRVEGEFRPVVTVFCNFILPDELVSAVSSSDVARLTTILSAYFNAMYEAISRFGGVITRIDPYIKGTKMLILFGAPVSHEDDPQRAVSTALTMNMALEQVNERLMQKFSRFLSAGFTGPLLQHRIGITYGDIFATEVGAATRREYTVMGDEVNLAARLMGAGKPGQILMSESMLEAVRHDFLTTTLNPFRVKGKSKPVPVFQVDAPAENILINRLEAVSPLISREAALAQARRCFYDAAAGKGKFLIIEGPAGIGKTHLADTLLLEARQAGAKLLAAQCRSYAEGAAYAAWGVLLRSAAGITNIDPPQLALEKFDRLIAPLKTSVHPGQERLLLGGLMGITPPHASQDKSPTGSKNVSSSKEQPGESTDYLAKLKDIPHTRRGSRLDFLDNLSDARVSETGQSWEPVTRLLDGSLRQRTYACVLRLLRMLSASQPLVLFFEDAHWLDEGTTDLLAAIQSDLPELPVLVLLAARNCTSDLLAYAERIQLSPFQEVETTNLVANILVSELGPLIFEQTGGNPLFISEVTHWIQRTRRIAAADLEDILRTSDVLQKLILSRVEKLPEISRQVVRTAAVIGTGFRISVLQAALGNAVDEVSLSNHLRTLVDASLLRPLEGGVDASYSFQQEFVRTVLYNSLSFDRRRELHGRIADSLISSKPSRRQLSARIAAFLDAPDVRKDERLTALVAYHQEGAERFLAAAQTYLKAAEMARQRQDWTDGQHFYEQVLRILAKHGPTAEDKSVCDAALFSALLGSADISIALNGEPGNAIALLERAAAIPEQNLSQEDNTGLRLRMAVLFPLQDKAMDALALLSRVDTEMIVASVPFANTLRAWLESRTQGRVTSQVLEKAEQEAAGEPALETLLAELSADWPAAYDGYAALGLEQSTAMIHIRWGDSLAANNDFQASDVHYLEAHSIWRQNGRNPAGLALAAYRHAEAASRLGKVSAARRALNHAIRHLKDSPAPIRQEGRILFNKTHRLLDAPPGAPWPAWHWHYLDDQLKIALLYPRFLGLGL